MTSERRRSGLAGAAQWVITAWALLGGALLLGIVLVNVYTVLGGMFGQPFPGDFEITEIGVAVAAFAFLPYCQLMRANVTADIFTMRAPPRLISVFQLLASLTALIFAVILLWRMFAGMLSQREYEYTTAILSFPIWWGFIPVVVSLALLCVAAFITLIEDGRDVA